MTDILATRYNDYDSDRLPYEFGVEWDTTSNLPALTRLGDAAALTVNTGVTPHTSSFTSYMPWMGMKRCVLNTVGGDVFAFEGDLDDDGSATLFTGLSSKVMVQIPKFWVKFSFGDAATKYRYYISPYPLKGYRLHPAFSRNGTVVDNIYVGAFEGFVNGVNNYMFSTTQVTTLLVDDAVHNTAGQATVLCASTRGLGTGDLFTITDSANSESLTVDTVTDGTHLLCTGNLAHEYKLARAPAYLTIGVRPTTVATRGTFRTAAELWNPTTVAGFGWTLLEYNVYSAIQLLYLVEYANLDSQTTIGEGIMHRATGAVKCGWTMGSTLGGPAGSTNLGSGSGRVDTGGGDYAISYRGIENLWGNTMTLLDGMNVDTAGRPYINYGGVVNAGTLTGYDQCYRILPTDTDWITTPTFSSAFREGCQFAPYVTDGGSASKYMCDTFTWPGAWGVIKIPRVGGKYDTGAGLGGGIFCLDVTFEVGTTGGTTGSRIQYVPYDYMGYHRY